MKNAGYEIKLLNTFEDSDNGTTGTAFGKAESPEAPGQYVTWEGHIDETGTWRWYWGHYFREEAEAMKDFGERVKRNLEIRGLTRAGLIALRRWSEMNPWIDFTVIVDAADQERAEEALRQAYDAYWDEEYDCYGDAVIDLLWDAEVPHLFRGHDDQEDEDPEYEAWFEDLCMGKDEHEWRGRE